MRIPLDLGAGRLFGVRIRVHLVFLLLLAWILHTSLRMGGGDAVVWALTRLAVALGSVLVHELGHSLATRALGGEVRDILLWPLGGVTRIRRLPSRPLAQAAVALGGPAANATVALLLLPFVAGSAESVPLDPRALFAAPLLPLAFALNVAMAVVNLVPAFPLDGGYLVRTLLRRRIGDAAALRVVVWPARAAGLASAPLVWWDDRWFPVALAGAFVWWMAEREMHGARRRSLPASAPADGETR